MALGFPPVLGTLAIGGAAVIHLRFLPYLKNAFQEALNDEKSSIEQKEKHNRHLRSIEKRLGLKPGWASEPGVDQNLLGRAKHWVREFSESFGIKKSPELLILGPEQGRFDYIETSSLKGELRQKLLREFNKHANAFAFSHEKGNVVLTDPIVKALKPSELKGVVAHEVGHLAAHHGKFREIMGLVTTPAKILTSLNILVTVFSSFKNAGLYFLASGLTDFATEKYARFAELDKEVPKEKARIDTFKRYFGQASLAGLALGCGAPEILVAQGINLLTKETIELVEKHYSRVNEFQADRLAAEVTRDPVSLCRALKTIQREHLKAERGFNYEPPKPSDEKRGILSSLFDQVRELKKTHPNVERRCDALMDIKLSSCDTAPCMKT